MRSRRRCLRKDLIAPVHDAGRGAEGLRLRGQERALRDAIPMLADRQRAQEEVAALEKKATSLEKGRADAVTAAAPLAEKLKVLQATESTLKAALERQKAISEIAAQRSVLKDGEACALCGSTTHPYVESGQLAEEDARIHQLLEQAGRARSRSL